MRFTLKTIVLVMIMSISGSDVLGLIELPLYASIGIFVVAMLIVLDTVFGGPKDAS